MTLEKVVDEIINKARDDASKMKREAKSEATSILKRAKEEAQNAENGAVSETEKMIDVMEKREIAATKLQCKRIELDSRKEVIDKLFETVKEKVADLDEKTKKRIYQKMLSKAMSEMDEAKFVYSNKEDAGILKPIARNLEIKNAEVLGGIIVENKDMNVRIDSTFDSMLDEVFSDCLKDVSKILFE